MKTTLIVNKTLATLIFCVASLLFHPGCTKQREISGEIFTRDPKKGIMKEAGTVIYFLTAAEHERFESLLRKLRDEAYTQERKTKDDYYKEYSELFDKHKKEDGKVHGDAGQDVMNDLKRFEKGFKDAEIAINEKSYDRRISLGNEFISTDEDKNLILPIKQFMTSVHRTIADVEGKFKVILSLGGEYWVAAESNTDRVNQWYFRYVSDGINLVLSDGNKM